MKRIPYLQLLKWKESEGRKPLILNGARQIGKTWLLKEFGQNEFEHLTYIFPTELLHKTYIFPTELLCQTYIFPTELLHKKARPQRRQAFLNKTQIFRSYSIIPSSSQRR